MLQREVPLPKSESIEYKAPPSNLPETVPAAQILEECRPRWDQWPREPARLAEAQSGILGEAENKPQPIAVGLEKITE